MTPQMLRDTVTGMSEQEAAARLNQLTTELIRHNRLYHELDAAEIDDRTYDLLYRELELLEVGLLGRVAVDQCFHLDERVEEPVVVGALRDRERRADDRDAENGEEDGRPAAAGPGLVRRAHGILPSRSGLGSPARCSRRASPSSRRIVRRPPPRRGARAH